MLETSARLLELLALMQARRRWSGPELAERLEVGVRTVRRDIERLRRLGYPVEAIPGAAGGYRLAAGASLPPLLLDDEEATAIAVGLRTAARSSVSGIEQASVRALVKLEQVLPTRLRHRVNALGTATATLPPEGPTVDPEALTVIATACRDCEGIDFDYTSREGVDSHRQVEPHSLVNLGRRWYLIAWDRGRLDWRSFRVDRLASPAPSGFSFVQRTLPAVDGVAFVSMSMTAAPHRYEARVTMRASADAVSERMPSRWGTVEAIDERSCEYRSGDDDLEWLAIRLVMVGVDFEVHEPPELIEHVGALAERLAEAAGSGRWPRVAQNDDPENASRHSI